ncbi:MAG: GNAT family N-acetyltransferase [Nitratireductor sp.]
MATLARMRSDWEAVYEADPEAQYFLSWAWLSPWLSAMRASWMILVARTDDEHGRPVAFLPLRFRRNSEAKQKGGKEVMMAGNCSADYSGLLCVPRHQDQAIPELGRYLKKQNWDLCDFQYVSMSRKRRQMFLSRFSRRDFELTEVTRELNRDGINNHVCPRVALPDDFDTYLETKVGRNTRQKIRRFLRKIDDEASEFRIEIADATSINRSLDILQELWLSKWGARKGPSRDSIISNMRGLLAASFKQGTLFMPVLWRNDEPLGALGIYIDEIKRSMLFSVAGCRTDINNPAPGLALHAFSIRHAIEQGITTYDFLRGDEPYKYAFGAEDHQLSTIVIRPRRAKTKSNAPAKQLDMPAWYEPPAHVVAQGGSALMAGKMRISVNGLPTQSPSR